MIERERLEDLVLARLSVSNKQPPSPSDLQKILAPFVKSQLTDKEWREELGRALASLRAAGAIQPKKRLLTATGRQRLAAALGLKDAPVTKDWTQFKTNHLRSLLTGGTGEASDYDPGLTLVAQELGLPPEAARSPAQLGNAWLANLLGVSPKGLGLATVRAALLAREFNLSKHLKDERKLFGQLAVKYAGAKRAGSAEIVQALAGRWLSAGQRASKPAPRAPATAARTEGSGLDVLGKIRAALRSPGAKHFGDNKVFISSVWQVLRADPELEQLGEAGFKRVLLEAHQRGELSLSRADLVSAMDPADVAASELPHLNATYHFIQISEEQT